MCEVCGGELWLCVDVCSCLLVVVYEGGLFVLDNFRLEILSYGAQNFINCFSCSWSNEAVVAEM